MMKTARRRVPPGHPPGSLPVEVDEPARPATIEIIDYSPSAFTRTEVSSLPDDARTPPDGTVRWIRIAGVPRRRLLSQMGSLFGVHPLVLSDVASTTQRIKTENYQSYTYTVLRTLHSHSSKTRDLELDLLLFDRVVISVDEGEYPDFFEPIFKRLDNAQSMLRAGGADVLYYGIFDLAVDCYFPLLDEIEGMMESLEQSILDGPRPEHIDAIHRLRSSLRMVRTALWSTRDVTQEIDRSGVFGVSEQTRFYFRDIYDHVIHLLDTATDLRESAANLRELHSAGVGYRMNEVMKVLTIISTVFIPITFVAGVYGMNFVHMPELGFRWSYPAVIGLMIVIVGGMLVFFRRRKWF